MFLNLRPNPIQQYESSPFELLAPVIVCPLVDVLNTHLAGNGRGEQNRLAVRDKHVDERFGAGVRQVFGDFQRLNQIEFAV